MSDSSINKIVQYGTAAARAAFTPAPPAGIQTLYIWFDTDASPATWVWNGAAWVQINAAGGSGINQLTGDVTAGPGTGSQAATIANNAVSNAKLADMAALTVKVRAANSSGDPSDVALTDGEVAKRVGTAIISAVIGRIASVTFITTPAAGATYTVPAGIYGILVIGVGAGGGGGGADGDTSQAGCGGGGNSGGWFIKVYAVVPGDTKTYTITVGGTAGAAGNNAGAAGGDTTFDNGGTVITAPGGAGGGSMASGTGVGITTVATAPAAGTNGDVNIPGNRGTRGYRFSGSVATPGTGGDSPFGCIGGTSFNADGAAPVGYGAGGSGGLVINNTTDRAGTAGAPGCIIVLEFK